MNTTLLDMDGIWAAIDAQRLRTADMLDDLTEAEWDRPSLCDGWRVRDVAAHLTLQQMTFGKLMTVMLQNLGGLNHVIQSAGVKQARRPKETFAPAIRAMVGSRAHNFGVTPRESLMDAMVHAQDIAIPLGRTMEMDPLAAATAAERVWSFQGKGMAGVFRNLPLQRMRLTATDIDWSAGPADGAKGAGLDAAPEIRGPIAALLLLLTGRTVALKQLSGEGLVLLK